MEPPVSCSTKSVITQNIASVITMDLKDRVDANVHENRQFTLDELQEVFKYVLLPLLYKTVRFNSDTEKFVPDGFQEISQRSTSRDTWALLCRFWNAITQERGMNSWGISLTGDETWVSHYTSESKQQSQEWHHTHSPTKKP
jgi:hypothetical protein